MTIIRLVVGVLSLALLALVSLPASQDPAPGAAPAFDLARGLALAQVSAVAPAQGQAPAQERSQFTPSCPARRAGVP